MTGVQSASNQSLGGNLVTKNTFTSTPFLIYQVQPNYNVLSTIARCVQALYAGCVMHIRVTTRTVPIFFR